MALLVSALLPLCPQCLVYSFPNINGVWNPLLKQTDGCLLRGHCVVYAAGSDLPARPFLLWTSELRVELSVFKLCSILIWLAGLRGDDDQEAAMSLNMAFNLNRCHVITYPVLERTWFRSYRGTGDL